MSPVKPELKSNKSAFIPDFYTATNEGSVAVILIFSEIRCDEDINCTPAHVGLCLWSV